MNYYIDYNGTNAGPFDLLGIIRKIRNGSLDKNQPVLSDEDEAPKPAYQHKVLYDVFIEQDKAIQEEEEYEQTISLGGFLKNAFDFLKDDQSSIIFAGVFLILVSALTAGLHMKAPLIVAAIAAPILSYGLFQIFFLSTLRLSRVQLLSWRYISEILKKHWLALFISALLPALCAFTIPWIASSVIGVAGWGISLLLGIPAIIYCLYIPLLIVDRNLNIKEAFALNHKVIKSLGMDGISVMFGLLLICAVTLPVIFAALFIVPICTIALCELYDVHFNGY